MKRAIAALLSSLVPSLCGSQTLNGTVNFSNYNSSNVNAPDYLCDSITRLSGPQYVAQLWAGADTNQLSPIALTSFSTFGPGYFFGGSTYAGQCGYIVFAQVKIWNTNAGTTFELAQSSGLSNAWAQSSVFSVGPLGGYCCDPPCIPPDLVGLASLSLNGPYQPPQLGIMMSPTNALQLFWPYGVGNFAVEQNPDLHGTNWATLTNQPTVDASTNWLSLQAPTGTMFFRLVAQP